MALSARLQPVKRVADTRERDAAREFGDAQRLLQAQHDKLDQLKEYHREYVGRFHEAARGGISASRMMEFRSFISRLEQAISQQEDELVRARENNDRARAAWQQKQSRSKALGKAVERHQAHERRQADKKEQAEQDERSQHVQPVH